MIKGCDISHHQGNVDFQALKDDGMDFAIIRATYGDGYTDREYEVNRDKVRQVGMLAGYYHYSYPQYNAPEAEADWFTKVVSCQPGEIICLDFEENYPTPVDWCKRFLDKAKSNMGFKPYVYLNRATIDAHDWSPVIDAGYELWLAHWTYDPDAPPPTKQWDELTLWQYSNNGNVGGISPLDLNVFQGTKKEFKESGNPAPSEPTDPPTPTPPDDLITPDQYFGKYDQKYIDWDKHFGFQCMDNYRYFVDEVKGFPQSPAVVGAYQVWDTYLSEYFDRIENTPTNGPVKGDIIIWSQEVGRFGHIAVCKDGDSNSFTSFDQNWPVGSACHFQLHSYYGVLGWLREKGPDPIPGPEPPTDPSDPCEKAVDSAIAETDAKWQSEVESANENLESCEVNLRKKKKTIVQEMSFWEFMSLKFGR